jgi:Rrf2 family protein
MLFSKTCEYAIRACIYIAQQSGEDKKVAIKEIAKGIDSPEHFIAKILQNLSKKGFINSVKGPNGGFYMDKKNLKTTISDIVLLIDGDSLFTKCVLGLKQCSETKPCPLHNQYKHTRKEIIELFRCSRIGQISEQVEFNETFLKIK